MLKTYPNQDQLLNFAYQTHALEKININMPEIVQTYQGKIKTPNPYAHGFFQALGFAYNHLIDKDHFPGKPTALIDPNKADAALFWLRELHKILLLPVA